MNPNDLAGAAEWIMAPATARGPAALAVVRLDGAGCWRAAAALCGRATPPAARRMTLTSWRDAAGGLIDEGLLVWFPAPHSYTGNDLVELHCHGAAPVVRALLDALGAQGARMARPGEFTQRAFLNGRMDLAQAEGVANLIAAQTEAAGRAALAQVRGALSERLHALRGGLLDLAAEIEARIDFPEEDVPEAERRALLEALGAAERALDALLATARRGRILRDGARAAIAGRPNAGKSSLFNALLGAERALVTPHPGTTRDTIEATVDLGGAPLTLVDTAGVRESGAGEIEALGIRRTMEEVARAALVVVVLDASAPPMEEDRTLLRKLRGKPLVCVLNKSDLPARMGPAEVRALLGSEGAETPEIVPLSALDPATLGPLEGALERLLAGDEAGDETVLLTNLRHEERLCVAREALERAGEALAAGDSGECAMVDLNEALGALSETLGLALDDAVLSRIFSRFCIGK